jgi:hypothetical protein
MGKTSYVGGLFSCYVTTASERRFFYWKGGGIYMSIEYEGLPKSTILRINYPDYAEHLRRTKIHNNGQQKSERNKQRAIEHKLKRKKDTLSSGDQKVDSRLRLSLIDGSLEMDSSLKPLKPITIEDLKKLLPKKGVIFESKLIKSMHNSKVSDPLGL